MLRKRGYYNVDNVNLAKNYSINLFLYIYFDIFNVAIFFININLAPVFKLDVN